MIRRKFLAILALAAAAALTPRASAAQEVLRASTAVQTSHWLVKEALAQWAEDVKLESKGQLTVNILSTPLGSPSSQFEMARDGVVDLVYANPGLTPGRFVLLEVGGLPGIANTGEALSVGLQRLIEKTPAMQKEFEGVKLLAVYVQSPYQIYTTSSAAIDSPQGFEGKKIRTAGGVLGDAVTAIGAVPINQPFSKTYELMANGVTDGTVSSLDSVMSLKLTRLLKHVTMIPGGVGAAPVVFVMNAARFDKLSKENQDALMRASGVNMARIFGKMFDEKSAHAVAGMKKDGVDVRVADGAFAAEMHKKLDAVSGIWLKHVKESRNMDGADLIKAMKAEAAQVK
jgi:TRAP-type C4-dicarboxylate transport system substrate-binding protein